MPQPSASKAVICQANRLTQTAADEVRKHQQPLMLEAIYLRVEDEILLTTNAMA